MENFFTNDNWNFSQYRNNDQFAIISMVAEPGILDVGFTYCVTLLDDDQNELYQSCFSSLMEACQHINGQYQDLWSFVDLRSASQGSGCSTCVAH